MGFITPLKVQLLSDRAQYPWILIAPLVYESEVIGDTVWVPEHFLTDGSSVPRALMLFFPPLAARFFGNGVWLGFKQAVVHDFLRRPDKDGNPPVPAKVAHLIFKEALTEAGYPDDLVSSYHAAVSLFNTN